MTRTNTSAPASTGVDDRRALAARLAWLASARSDAEAHLIESALLVRTDNSPHAGDPSQSKEQAR